MPFPGFPKQALPFFRELKRNNTREWFAANKDTYDQHVRAPMIALTGAINSELAEWAPGFVRDPEKAVYRIYRDTRFSADKTPYKTLIAANFWSRKLHKHSSAGYYVAISPSGADVGGGVYMPGPEETLAIRSHIAANWSAFEELDRGGKLRSLVGELRGDSLVRPPKGFPASHPADVMLRRKQWYYYVTLDADLIGSPKLLPEIVKRFKAMQPLVDFLNTPLLAKKQRSIAPQ